MTKLKECRTCKTAGHPNQMITFKKSARINPTTNKPYWDLINENSTDHKHLNGPSLDTTTTIPSDTVPFTQESKLAAYQYEIKIEQCTPGARVTVHVRSNYCGRIGNRIVSENKGQIDCCDRNEVLLIR